jgi:Sodium:dicarboxylate symporter family.
MAAVLLVLALLNRFIPDSQKSASVPVAILCFDNSASGEAAVSDIVNMNSIYKYYRVSSSDEMYQDIASGKADSGFIIPADYFKNCTSYLNLKDIRIIINEGSTFPSLAADEVYSIIFKYSVAEILDDTIKSSDVYKDYTTADLTLDNISENTVSAYKEYISGDSIFHVEDISGGKYNELTNSQPIDIPVRKLSGFFILAAALLGLLNFIIDKESGLFIRMTTGEHLFMRLIEVLVLMLPVSIISYIAILTAHPGEGALQMLVHTLLYSLGVCLFTLIVSIIIRKSTLMKGVLPVYLILALVFSGAFFDLSGYNGIISFISGLFPTYYF